ncbi:MAG TPA: hypothetical protein VGE07_00510 [Herpetosiphonaceae bacterium]
MTEQAYIELFKNGGLALGLLVVVYFTYRNAVPWVRDWLTKLSDTLQKLVEVVSNLNQTLVSQHAATETNFKALHDLVTTGQQDIKVQLAAGQQDIKAAQAAQAAQLLDIQLRQAVIYGRFGLSWDEQGGGPPLAPTGSRRDPQA